MSDEPQELDDDTYYFEGPCTCGHDEDDHGWGSCDVDGCDCKAHFAE